MPTLTLIAAQSLDGFITRHDEPGTDFCGSEDAQFLSATLKEFDSMIMGRKTFETLRDRIVASHTTRYLRKICTRKPADFAHLSREGLIEFTDAAPSGILEDLEARGRSRCALLGGGEIYTRFLEADLVDELWLTLEPKLFGTGTPIVASPIDRQFMLESMTKLGQNTALLKYARSPTA